MVKSQRKQRTLIVAAGALLPALLMDCRRRVARERRAQEQQSVFRDIAERASDAIVVVQDARVRYCNLRITDLLGYERSEVLGQPFDRYAQPAAREELRRQFYARLQGDPAPSRYNVRMVHRDGHLVDIEVNAGLMWYHSRPAVLASLRDMSERRRYEAALQANRHHIWQLKESIEAILNHSSDGIALATLDGEIRQTNPAFDSMLGYRPDALFMTPLTALTAPADARLLAALIAEIPDHRTTARLEMVLRRSDGTRFDGDVMLSTIFDEDNRAVKILATLRDITAQNREAVARQEAQRRRHEQTNRLKDDVVRMVSHDLKNPIHVILGYVDLLQTSGAITDATEMEYLERIARTANDMNRLIVDLLDLARLEAGNVLQPEPIPLNVYVAGISELYRDQAGQKGLALRFIPTADDATIMVDSQRMAQALHNLLSNAIKYTPGGGAVEVATEVQAAVAAIHVRDTGIGIPAADQTRIFERYYRADDPDHTQIEGTGMGLAIASTIVEQHGGLLTVESTVDQGSTFTIKLPISAAGAGGTA